VSAKTRLLFIYIKLLILILIIIPATQALSAETIRDLRGGWYLWKPYQYEKRVGDLKHLTGLDIKLVSTIFQNAGYRINYDEVDWKEHQIDIKNGKRDIAAGAFRTREREEYAYLSEPYRKETVALYVLANTKNKFKSVDDMLKQFRANNFKLGVIDGYIYGPDCMEYINAPENQSIIIPVKNDYVNFDNLLDGRIDGFLVDRLVGATILWEQGWRNRVKEYPMIIYSEDIHVLFSKKNCSLEMVRDFNVSLSQMRESGKYKQIFGEHITPVLISITTGSRWFFVVEIIGTAAFAISGMLLARKEQYDIIGAFVLAALPALGGGILRDLLVNREPIGILRTPVYIITVFGMVILGYIFFRITDVLKWNLLMDSDKPFKLSHGNHKINIVNNLYQIFDAIGLAAFTVLGVAIAIETKSWPLWIWGPLLAMLTGAGGGIIRDIVRVDAKIAALKGSFYPEIAIFWGLLLSLFLNWQTQRLNLYEVQIAVITTLIGAFLMRILAIYFNIRSPLIGK